MLSHEELEDSLSGKAHKSLQYGINWQSSVGNLPPLRHSQRGQRLLFVPCPRTNSGRGQLPTWDAISGLKLQIIQLWKISIWCFSSEFRIVGHAVKRISLALKEVQEDHVCFPTCHCDLGQDLWPFHFCLSFYEVATIGNHLRSWRQGPFENWNIGHPAWDTQHVTCASPKMLIMLWWTCLWWL